MPPTISLEQMTGFSLFMLKAVLEARSVPLLELEQISIGCTGMSASVQSVNREMNEELDFPYIILDLIYVIARKSPYEYWSLNRDLLRR